MRTPHDSCVRLLRDSHRRAEPFLPALTVQLAWMLVDQPGSERDLFVLLRNARTRTDYSAEQRKALNDIWTAWLTRSANASMSPEIPGMRSQSLKPVFACCQPS